MRIVIEKVENDSGHHVVAMAIPSTSREMIVEAVSGDNWAELFRLALEAMASNPLAIEAVEEQGLAP